MVPEKRLKKLHFIGRNSFRKKALTCVMIAFVLNFITSTQNVRHTFQKYIDPLGEQAKNITSGPKFDESTISSKKTETTNKSPATVAKNITSDAKFDEPTTAPQTETTDTSPATVYNEEEYQKALTETLKVLPGIQTAALSKRGHFYSGLNNQIYRFIGTCLLANMEKTGQIVEESIKWKDTFGTNKRVSHYRLWDVVHWNSFFPTLPRFASYDSEHHPHLQPSFHNITIEGKAYPEIEVKHRKLDWDMWVNKSITHPRPMSHYNSPHQNLNQYSFLAKAIDRGKAGPDKMSPDRKDHLAMYSLMMKGALRPHPFLQKIVTEEMSKLRGVEGGKYMTLHARVEPDMARQDYVCADRKVPNMTHIIDGLYEKFPEPPVNTILIQFSRALMEREAARTDENRHEDPFYILNEHNLKEINRIVKDGMWDGKVKLVEAGSSVVAKAGDPFYKKHSTIAGGIVNLYLAIESDIMVGSEISTYSVQAVNSRYYREKKENYFYLPSGLYWVTPPERKKPFRFGC